MEAIARTPGSRPELVGGLPAHQGHDPVRSALDLDLRHHGVAHDASDQADEAVARRGGDDRPGLGVVTALGDLLGEPGQVDPVDDLARPSVVVRNRPDSPQRRTVSSLTPSSSAACLIRYDAMRGL